MLILRCRRDALTAKHMIDQFPFYLALIIAIMLIIMLANKIKVAYPVLLVMAGLLAYQTQNISLSSFPETDTTRPNDWPRLGRTHERMPVQLLTGWLTKRVIWQLALINELGVLPPCMSASGPVVADNTHWRSARRIST